MKKLLFFAVAIVAGVVTSFGANTWTKESWSSSWSFPEDILTRADSQNNGFCDLNLSGFGAGSANKTWTFAEPKDISSVQILMAGNGYKVSAISVQYAGTEDFVTIDGSELDFTKGTDGNTRMVFTSADSQYFAENVVGLNIVLTDINPYWANAQEILVTGKTRGVAHRWKVGTYAEGEWAPAADRLKGLTNGADGWGAPAANLEDDNTATFWCSGGQTLVWDFDTPKRIRRIRLAGADGAGGGFKVNSVSVKYKGTDDYVVIPGSTLDYFYAASSRYSAEFSADDGLIASSVVSVKVAMSVLDWRFAIGEAEIDGADSFVSTLDADYLVANGRLNTKLTGVASEYPIPVYICTGEVDGGKDASQWDHVVKVGELTDAETPLEDSRLVDFKFCRFYFPDIDNEAWSEPFELVLEPSATAQVTERRSTDAKIETVIDCCGGTNEVAAVYLAYAQKGEELPAYTLVEANVPTGKTVSVKVTGLTSLATYAYQVKVVNVDDGELVIPGEFDSRGQCYWEKTSFVPADWTSPEDRIPCRASPLYDNRVLRDQGQGNLNSNSVITCSWTEPKDIETIEVYTYGDRSWRLELLNVQVKFDGDEDYTLLTGSHLNYTENPGTGVKLAVLHGSDGLVAQKVTSVKIQSGHWANGHASGIGELVFRGKTSGSEVKWDYRAVASADGFALPDDVLTNDLVKVSGFSANEKDADLTTETDEYAGKSWTWSFAKPHDIRTVELWGYGYSARSAFGIASVQYKRKGDEGWTKVVGSALELFNYYTNGHCAQLRGEKKWLLRDVTDLKLVLGEANNAYVLTAEVFCTGARSVHGLMMIVK